MAKEDYHIFKGTITEVIPGSKFKVTLENGHTLNATISGKIRKNNIRILLHDQVEVEVSTYDVDRGRISYRF